MAITRKKAVAMVKRIPVMTWDATKALALFLWEIIRNPRVLKDKLAEAQHHLKEVRPCLAQVVLPPSSSLAILHACLQGNAGLPPS